jgi:hypothetical protein
MDENRKTTPYYFNLKELVIIIIIGVLGAIAGQWVPYYLMPGGQIPNLVHTMLHLPGPGAGIVIFGGILCFWLLLAAAVIQKRGATILTSIVIIAVNLILGYSLLGTTAGIFEPLIVAILIELFLILPIERSILRYALPIVFGAFIIICLAQLAAGQVIWLQGQSLWPGVPLMLVLGAILALGSAKYPSKYVTAGAFANLGYLIYFFAEPGGKGWPTVIHAPPLVVVALVGGGLVGGVLAVAVERLIEVYQR